MQVQLEQILFLKKQTKKKKPFHLFVLVFRWCKLKASEVLFNIYTHSPPRDNQEMGEHLKV